MPVKSTVAEEIAKVVATVRAGRAVPHLAGPALTAQLLGRARLPQPTIDATAIYRATVERARGPGVNLYNDFPTVVPPWPEATIAYVNEHGNVMVLQAHMESWLPELQWETDNPVDWDRVRWLVEASVWVGGHERAGVKAKTYGPVRLLQHAVYDDGRAADMRWVSMIARSYDDPSIWDMPTAVFNATMNFLACSNVEIAEPERPFPVRQRLRKTRVQVQTIVVRPPGKRTRSSAGDARPFDALDTPLTSVRGSFGHYGPKYERGLLFGRLEGKFWRPAHARGAGDGFEQKDYVLRTD